MYYILLTLLRSFKSCHKPRVTLNTTRCSGILTENVIIVGGQGLSYPCENKQVDAFTVSQYLVKTESRQLLTGKLKIYCSCITLIFIYAKHTYHKWFLRCFITKLCRLVVFFCRIFLLVIKLFNTMCYIADMPVTATEGRRQTIDSY